MGAGLAVRADFLLPSSPRVFAYFYFGYPLYTVSVCGHSRHVSFSCYARLFPTRQTCLFMVAMSHAVDKSTPPRPTDERNGILVRPKTDNKRENKERATTLAGTDCSRSRARLVDHASATCHWYCIPGSTHIAGGSLWVDLPC